MQNEVKTGTVAGTGAAINVLCGFKPRYVKVFNPNDAGSLFPTIEWWEGMAAASGCLTLSIVDSGTTALKSSDYITADGISQYAGTAAANSEGFVIGANANINASGESVFWIAIR